jgi:hypothetical protein
VWGDIALLAQHPFETKYWRGFESLSNDRLMDTISTVVI